MNEDLIDIATYLEQIATISDKFPSQYQEKINELCSTIMSVSTMALGVNVINIDPSLGDGTHIIDGHTITIENGTLRIWS